MMLYYQTTFACKQTSSLEDIVKIVKFCPPCDLDIEDSEPIFYMTHCLVKHHHSNFGKKLLSNSGDTERIR